MRKRLMHLPLLTLLAAIFFFPQSSSANDITLAWDPSTSAEVAGYWLYWGTISGQYTNVITAGKVTTYTVSGLTAGTYYFAVVAYGSAGETSAYSNEISAIITSSDTQAPSISAIGSSSIGTSSATIFWATNELSDSQVEYGTTSSYGNSTTLNTAMVTSHSQSLGGLTSGTTYYYRVKSRDAAGNLAISSGNTFTTSVLSDTTAPVISGVTGSAITGTGATITWTTNEASNSQVEYGTTTSYGNSTSLNSSLVTAHSQALSGLIAGATYYYRVRSRDAAGNLAVSSGFTFITSDTTPPTISSVTSSGITGTGATITWTTNETSNSQVEYGTTTSYGNSTSLNGSLVTAHSQALSGLTAGTTYYFRVKSSDAAGNPAVSDRYSFTTTSPSPDIITGLAAAYAFNEGTGSVAADSSGSGNRASLISATWTSGKYGNALSFNGSSSFAYAGVSGLPGINQPMTISCWIYIPSRYTSAKTILALANPALRASVQLGHKNYQSGVLSYGDNWIVVGRIPSLGLWNHLGYVFDGTQNRYYVNGTLIGTSTITNSSAPVTSFQIGRWIGGSEYFRGSIDDLRIYRRALSQDELKLAMNTPIAASGAAAATSALVSESFLAADEISAPAEPAKQSAANPAVNIQLERQAYKPGSTVRISSLRISNLSSVSRSVEAKIWLALPGMQPISLNDLATDEITSLPAGFDHEYGAIPFLKISRNAPAGTCVLGARLVDPDTGNILSEDITSFVIAGGKGAASKAPAAGEIVSEENPRIVLESYREDSRLQYSIENQGGGSADIEMKVWLENSEGDVIPAFSVGAEGQLSIPAGAMMTLDPLSSLHIIPGTYVIKTKILDSVSGEILSESSGEWIVSQ
jgi:hypothetical protein